MFKSKSEIISEGLRQSFRNTNCKMANRRCYGYDISPNGDLTVNQAEAEVVRWIFGRYLAGDSFGKIAVGLERQGVLSPARKVKWNREAISKLLSNEKYTGSVLLQKTMSFAGTQFPNDGELEMILIKNHHEAIISDEDFERTQQMKNERSKNQMQDFGIKMSL